MPKHVPNFKHFLTTTQVNQPSEYREKSVNDLIAHSRIHQPLQRDSPTYIVRGERVWAPGAGIGGLPDVEDGGVHPAELLRRSHVSQRQASRSVAGPAPPPSWRRQVLNASTGTPSTTETPQSFGPVTADDFYRASALFSRPLLKPPNRGPNRLVEHCFLTVLRYLDDDDEVFHQTVADEDNLDEEHDDTRGWTRGELLREQSTYLASSLKSALLDMSSLQPEGSDLRLSDTSLRAILRYSSAPATSYSFERSDEWERSSSHSTENWETEDTTIHHLPLTLHPSAHSFLRLLPSFNSLPLTSLNLAYSTVPIEFEKLVNVLPSGLRELGLAGVRVGRGKSDGQNDWRRGLGALARKLIVLRMLDLSFPPFPISDHILTTLLQPPTVKLPSLKLLGLRGIHHGSQPAQSKADGLSPPFAVPVSEETFRQWRDIIKIGRLRWVEAIWH